MAEMKNQRTTYGETLVALAAENKDIVVLDADLSKSTMGTKFEAAYPGRFYEMGIAEANMAGVAAGLSLTGKVPFMATFAVFATARCYDQIRTGICIPRLNVKICGSSAGLSDYGDGSTHQSIEDMAIMRALPNLQVLVPADATQTRRMVEYMAANPGPMYIRLNRNDVPEVTRDEPFVPGRVITMREGSDVAIFACGLMVSMALKAAEALEKEGLSAAVVNVPSVKPLDSDAVRKICAGVRAVVTAEEGTVMGGMGSAVAEAVVAELPKKIRMVGVRDEFGASAAGYDELLRAYGLTPEAIAAAVRESLK